MRVIEYILAFIILVSFIPLFNIVIQSYYTVKPQMPVARFQDFLLSTVKQVINYEYSHGNLTPELIDLDAIIRDKIGEEIISGYGYRVIIYSSVRRITVNYTTNEIIVETLDNYPLHLLVYYNDGLTQQIDKQSPDESINGEYYYVISSSSLTHSIHDVDALIAILESRTSRYIGYWFSDNIYKGYVLNTGSLTVFINSTIQLTPMNLYGYYALNTSITYYNAATQKYQYYSHKYFEIIYETILYPYYQEKEVHLNKTNIQYILDTQGSKQWNNYNEYQVKELRVDTPSTRWYECYDDIYYTCRLIDETDGQPVSTVNTIYYPIYNALLLRINDYYNNRVYVPVYRGTIILGEESVPSTSVLTVKSYMRIGMFDYNILLIVWRK